MLAVRGTHSTRDRQREVGWGGRVGERGARGDGGEGGEERMSCPYYRVRMHEDTAVGLKWAACPERRRGGGRPNGGAPSPRAAPRRRPRARALTPLLVPAEASRETERVQENRTRRQRARGSTGHATRSARQAGRRGSTRNDNKSVCFSPPPSASPLHNSLPSGPWPAGASGPPAAHHCRPAHTPGRGVAVEGGVATSSSCAPRWRPPFGPPSCLNGRL